MQDETDWKLKLRYGKETTPYSHYTIIADGVAGDLVDGFECRPGSAVMSMKAWASDLDEALDMIRSIGEQVGFNVSGEVEIYETEPEHPPKDNPYGYDLNFVEYDENE